MIQVQFSDSTQKTIVSYLSGAQDLGVYPNQGSVELTDSRYAAFYSSLPSVCTAVMPAPQSAPV
nr:MAG TPA: hypothetical protein [Caudoviricetes sp.]